MHTLKVFALKAENREQIHGREERPVKGLLQIAAYCSLAVAMALLLVRLFWPRLAPKVHVRRFRRTLGSAEHVLAAWADEFRAQDDRKRHEQRHQE